MSLLTEKEIVCPACKQPMEAEVWTSVNVKEDPELKDLLLGGELNIMECLSCKEKFFVDAFLLYHDPDNEIMAFVFPDEAELPGELLAEKMNADFEATQATLPENERIAYRPMSFKGLDGLLAFVEQDDEAGIQAEVLVAIAKEAHLPVRRLRPSLARDQRLPPVVPVLDENSKSPREAVVSGLRRLKELNDRLTIYNEALERLSKDPNASVKIS